MLSCLKKLSGRGRIELARDMYYCYKELGFGWLNYSCNGFHLQEDKEIRSSFLSNGDQFKFLPEVNGKEAKKLLSDKGNTLRRLKPLLNRKFIDLRACERKDFFSFVSEIPEFLAKPADESGGSGILILKSSEIKDADGLFNELKSSKRFVIEEKISQHEGMARLSLRSVNTMRILCCTDRNGLVSVPYAAVRASMTDGEIDNVCAGGVSAVVDEEGRVLGPMMSLSPEIRIFEKHPVTGLEFKGYALPMFKECVELVKKASGLMPEAGYIGWDVAVSERGPEIIEANYNPSPDLGQTYASLPDDGRGVKAAVLKALSL